MRNVCARKHTAPRGAQTKQCGDAIANKCAVDGQPASDKGRFAQKGHHWEAAAEGERARERERERETERQRDRERKKEAKGEREGSSEMRQIQLYCFEGVTLECRVLFGNE